MVCMPFGCAKPSLSDDFSPACVKQQPEVSMNDLLLKGPDVLNPIRAVLLRFRRGVYAALGDIKKIIYIIYNIYIYIIYIIQCG